MEIMLLITYIILSLLCTASTLIIAFKVEKTDEDREISERRMNAIQNRDAKMIAYSLLEQAQSNPVAFTIIASWVPILNAFLLYYNLSTILRHKKDWLKK